MSRNMSRDTRRNMTRTIIILIWLAFNALVFLALYRRRRLP
jgi:hypothetical protein